VHLVLKLENRQSEEFKNEAEQKWIIFKADFPNNILPASLSITQKKISRERYNTSGNFPLVLLLDKAGTVLAGYKTFHHRTHSTPFPFFRKNENFTDHSHAFTQFHAVSNCTQTQDVYARSPLKLLR
jgi:hypothetical protein